MQNSIQGMIQFLKNIHCVKKYDNVTLSHCWYILSQSFREQFNNITKSCKIIHTIRLKNFNGNFPMKIIQNVEKLTLQIYFQITKYSEPPRVDP